jgi:hypothetical protein
MKRKYLLIIPLCLHLVFATFVCLAGKWALLPEKFNENGLLLMKDNLDYHAELVSLVNKLRSDGFPAFARTPSSPQVKIYSLSFYLLGPLFGDTMMSAEPVNALFYLAILYLLFGLSRLVCSREASLMAAGVVAVWPSFLLHTTQLLKEPLFISAMLALVFITLRWFLRVHPWRTALISGLAGATCVALIWMVRAAMRDVAIVVGVLGVLLLLAKQIREKRFLTANTTGAAIVILACLSVPKFITPYHGPSQDAATVESIEQSSNATKRSRPLTIDSPLATKITGLRERFIDQYRYAGSNIDTEVRFNSIGDMVRYMPRALAIGLFAPFPQMWFSEGKEMGASGRILAGLETLTMYVCELLAAFAVWRMRRKWETWLLLLIALAGVISLGLIVTNIGALFRMRYVFWMLLIPLGAEGAVQALKLLGVHRKRSIRELVC